MTEAYSMGGRTASLPQSENPPQRWAQQTSYAPRGLRTVAAAAYLGVSKSKFLELVQEQRLPSPVAIDAVRVWDRLELDAAFDGIKTEPAPINSFDAILGLKK